jgi:ribosomal-protein-alanine N-acetyltransferase
MTVRIVRGTAEDLDSVMQVMKVAFPDRYGEAWTRSQCAGILPMTGVTLTLAKNSGDESIGFSLYRTIAGESELLLLAVDPKAQRAGVGKRLLAAFIDDARANGAHRIHLEVRDGNPATQLYEAAGFAQMNRRRNYYRGSDGNQIDALTFALALDD